MMQHETEGHVEPLEAPSGPEVRADARRVTLALAGLGCPNCANRVRNALLQTGGVVDADVDVQRSLAHIWCDADSGASESRLVRAVAEASRGTHHRYLAVPLKSRFGGRTGLPRMSLTR